MMLQLFDGICFTSSFDLNSTLNKQSLSTVRNFKVIAILVQVLSTALSQEDCACTALQSGFQN